MEQSRLESRLKRARLSSPGISFDEIAARARAAEARRPRRSLLRLAIAAAAVWLIACLAHIAVDRSIEAVAPAAGQALIADGGDASAAGTARRAFAARQKLMQELVAEGGATGELLPAPRKQSQPDGRSSELPERGRRVCHV
jgi:hypothetical protein